MFYLLQFFKIIFTNYFFDLFKYAYFLIYIK